MTDIQVTVVIHPNETKVTVVPPPPTLRFSTVIGASSITTVQNDLTAPATTFVQAGVTGALPATPTLGYSASGANTVPIVIAKAG